VENILLTKKVFWKSQKWISLRHAERVFYVPSSAFYFKKINTHTSTIQFLHKLENLNVILSEKERPAPLAVEYMFFWQVDEGVGRVRR
jgi:hypothetical protein